LRPATTSTLTSLQINIVLLNFSKLLHIALCLPADSLVSPAQILLQLINDCENVTLHLLLERPIVLCTCLPADSSPPTTVARNQTHLSQGNCISPGVISKSEIHLSVKCLM
ncbi:hypothetical protein AVEN_21644-1, partial [Araneus ventricosus]